MSMRSRSVRLAAVAVLVVTAAACTKTLDTDGLETELQSQIEDQTQSPVTSVDCPADVKVETGGSFECTAEQEGGATLTIRVTQSDDQGNVEWIVVDAAGDPGAEDGAGDA
jgi:hypothetical protein